MRGILLAALMLVSGCFHGPEVLPLSPDYPTLGKSRSTRNGASSLVVSTDTWIDLNLGSGEDGTVTRPTGYTLFDSQGIELGHIRNYIGAHDAEPTVLELEPGRYLVRPDKPGKRPAVFWVVIEPGRLTEVDLLK